MRKIKLFLLMLFLAPNRLHAEDWPRWRGPDGNAVSSLSPLPTRWGQNENILWKTAIPGEGSSSPIVWGDSLFLTSALDDGERRLVHCLDRDSGQIRWSRAIVDKNPERTSAMTGHAASTPATDGQRVIAFFGNAGVVCYDFAGKQLWHRRLGEFDTELGLASSPVLDRDRVILVCDHDGTRFTSFDSYLIALDFATGKEAWKTERRGLERSWSTPILAPATGGKRELIVSGQDYVRAYDPETGRQLWQVAGTTGWVTPSPVFGHGLIFVTSGKDGPTLAVRPGGRGEVQAVWQHPRGGAYVCSPLLYADHLYVIHEMGFLTCWEARTGKHLYRERLPGKFTASPVAGDGKIYVTNEAGVTYVLAAGPNFMMLARNVLDEYTLASPAIAHGQLFLRTEKHVHAISAGHEGAK
ncbi:MAG: PQQ-binding-like beta-propeller repeat protein [Gemmataceae bacterium]